MSTSVPVNWFVDGRRPPEVVERVRRMSFWPGVRRMAVMPDAHPAGDAGSDTCVGVVLATEKVVYPTAVGGDIGCGMASVCLGRPERDVGQADAEELFRRLASVVPGHRHRERVSLPDGLDQLQLTDARLAAVAARDGAVQFGTLGRGNHFLELQVDAEDRLWLTVHSGSRAVGAAVSKHHQTQTAADAYLHDVEWCRRYAEASRRAMLMAGAREVAAVLGGAIDWDSLVACDHNHVQAEDVNGERLFVHRKGANSAGAGRLAVIAGSMGTRTLIASGLGWAESLCSSSHGAGRVLTRTEARRRIRSADFRRQMRCVYYDERSEAELIEEAPAAYRDIRRVMRAQELLTKVMRTLRPGLIYKG